MVYIPPGERHQFVNQGKRPFRFLMVLPIAQNTAE
jgi:oxalate decarboxylase/phosphoglucose isomerase-like protein (cupin superfamily)